MVEGRRRHGGQKWGILNDLVMIFSPFSSRSRREVGVTYTTGPQTGKEGRKEGSILILQTPHPSPTFIMP